MAESKEELKSLLMKVKEESGKSWLKTTFKKLRSWHPAPSFHSKQMGKQWKLLQTSFGAPKSLQTMTAAKKLHHLLLEKKAVTNLDSELESRDITSLTKVHTVKTMVFPVVMY